ncbi:MAG: putative molybdenum carrier protein [Pseudomonadota bacterium]
MIEKIVSGGQTGVDRAALDAAIALGIPHGGWLPRGRRAEDGPLPDTYQLKEMDSALYKDRTLRNVIDSDGTLIIARGPLTGGSIITLKAAKANDKPCLHINLRNIPAFLATSKIVEWLMELNIKILNVAGPRASKDPTIYDEAKKIIEGVYYLGMVKTNMMNSGSHRSFQPETLPRNLPGTVTAAVSHLISNMSLKDKATVANMTEREVLGLDSTLGRYISEKLDRWVTSSSFMASYIDLTGKAFVRTEAPAVILRELWQTLKVTHRLRVVK